MAGGRDEPYEGYQGPYAPYADEESEEPEEEGFRRGRITPYRFVVSVAFVGSVIVTAYALFLERTALQVPVLVSGLTVLGIALIALAVSGAVGASRAAEVGLSARAFWSALLGGVCALAAAGALGAAVVFALIWVSAR